MPGPHPAVAACRSAVRAVLRRPDGPAADARILVACSGGADSLALAAATAFETPRAGLRAGALVVDHRLQSGSHEVAQRAAAQCRQLGLDPVRVVCVEVGAGPGPEAAARQARYAAFARSGADLLLLGHTADDQAEQVLLGLVRGSGTRSLAGMPVRTVLPVERSRVIAAPTTAAGSEAPLPPGRAREEGGHVIIARPFLESVSRAQTQAACTASGLVWWEDPHNADPRYLRVRVRELLGRLEEELGPGIGAGLLRTAQIARADADLLDRMARATAYTLGAPPWPVAEVARLPEAVRARVWRRLVTRCGATGPDVGRVHVLALDALVTRWRGQGAVDVPGGLQVWRAEGLVHVRTRAISAGSRPVQ